MPTDNNWRQDHPRHLAEIIAREGLTLLGWRDVPTDQFHARRARSSRPSPSTCRCSSASARKKFSEDEFERRLYILRKSISNAI